MHYLFLFNGIIIFAQEYKFIEKCDVFKEWIAPSKMEYRYFLYRGDKSPLIYMTENDKTYRITDRKNDLRQLFTIDKISDTLKMQNFYTTLIVPHDPERIIKNIIVKNIGENKFSIKTYQKLKARKSNLEIIFTLKKSDYALVQYHFLDMSIIIQDQIYEALLKELSGNTNFQIETIDLDYRNGYRFHYNISKCVKTNWEINIQ